MLFWKRNEVKAVVSLDYLYFKYGIHFFSYYSFNQNNFTVVKTEFKNYQGKEQKTENKIKTYIFLLVYLTEK